ncbi:MAG: BglII/BstYI family type II restriction endonuclease [Eubacteriales bacterium]|nr:BglII/BstYI family type II restriction endonuclease [Eubacteriales bacterium]
MEFTKRHLEDQPQIFGAESDAYARFDFLKDRIGIEVQFGHSSFIGIDLLKFQVASYSNLDTIDFGIYITTTSALHYTIHRYHSGSLFFLNISTPAAKSTAAIPI